MPDGIEWWTPAQCAAALQISISAVRLMLRDGRLPARRLRGSRLLRIARADVDQLLEPMLPARAIETRPNLRVVP